MVTIRDMLLFQCPHGLELLQDDQYIEIWGLTFQCPHGLELLLGTKSVFNAADSVSMPSWA